MLGIEFGTEPELETESEFKTEPELEAGSEFKTEPKLGTESEQGMSLGSELSPNSDLGRLRHRL